VKWLACCPQNLRDISGLDFFMCVQRVQRAPLIRQERGVLWLAMILRPWKSLKSWHGHFPLRLGLTGP
jgi:hypothetical protein